MKVLNTKVSLFISLLVVFTGSIALSSVLEAKTLTCKTTTSNCIKNTLGQIKNKKQKLKQETKVKTKKEDNLLKKVVEDRPHSTFELEKRGNHQNEQELRREQEPRHNEPEQELRREQERRHEDLPVGTRDDRNYVGSNINQQNFPYVMVSKEFTQEQRNLILLSLQKAQNQLQKPEVLSCINKYATKEVGDDNFKSKNRKKKEDNAASKAIEFLSYSTNHPNLRLGKGKNVKSGLQYLYIDKFHEEDNVMGRAPLGIDVSKQDLSIGLNAYNLYHRNVDDNVWAGIIVHEILHNWGYNHTNRLEDTPSNFSYETGWCVERQGKDKLPNSNIGGALAE